MSGYSYQIKSSISSTGGRFSSSKRQISWHIFVDHRDKKGRKALDGDGMEYKISFVWSLISGKRLVILDGNKEIHFSIGKRSESKFQTSWTTPDGHNFKIVAQKNPIGCALKKVDLFFNGVKFSDMSFFHEIEKKTSAFAKKKGKNESSQSQVTKYKTPLVVLSDDAERCSAFDYASNSTLQSITAADIANKSTIITRSPNAVIDNLFSKKGENSESSQLQVSQYMTPLIDVSDDVEHCGDFDYPSDSIILSTTVADNETGSTTISRSPTVIIDKFINKKGEDSESSQLQVTLCKTPHCDASPKSGHSEDNYEHNEEYYLKSLEKLSSRELIHDKPIVEIYDPIKVYSPTGSDGSLTVSTQENSSSSTNSDGRDSLHDKTNSNSCHFSSHERNHEPKNIIKKTKSSANYSDKFDIDKALQHLVNLDNILHSSPKMQPYVKPQSICHQLNLNEIKEFNTHSYCPSKV